MFIVKTNSKMQDKAVELLNICAIKAQELGLKLPENVKVSFTLNSIRTAGRVTYTLKRSSKEFFNFEIQLHDKALAALPFETYSKTIIHEFCHVLQRVNYGDCSPHGSNFHYLMNKMGVEDSTRCHTYNLEKITGKTRRRQRRWEYNCSCQKHSIATVTHNRMQKGQERICKKCKSTLTWTGKEIK